MMRTVFKNRLKILKLSEFLSSSGSELSQHSVMPHSRTCWVSSKEQSDSSGRQITDNNGEKQHQRLGWGGWWQTEI